MSTAYYTEKLAAERLQLCYELAPPAVQEYLAAEIRHVLQVIRCCRADAGVPPRILEAGCGYGRVLRELAPVSGAAVGIDTSLASLGQARHYLAAHDNVTLVQMNALDAAFADGTFDLVCCVQNGISAFHVDQRQLLAAAVRVTAPGGTVLFSSYADTFWEQRLHWFRIQSAHGLVGEIDEAATGNGVIVCRDGFSATTVGPEQLAALAHGLGTSTRVEVIAGSSVFCEITV
jgi:2-polyprenyl-6-hydroxyphenyl methylase/3-demethylubiquinone-9 3-methyltransferase